MGDDEQNMQELKEMMREQRELVIVACILVTVIVGFGWFVGKLIWEHLF